MDHDLDDIDQSAICADLTLLREHLTIGKVHQPLVRKGVVVAWALMSLRDEAAEHGQPGLSSGDLPPLIEALTLVTRLLRHERHRHDDLPFDLRPVLTRLEAFRVALVMKAHDDALIAGGLFR